MKRYLLVGLMIVAVIVGAVLFRQRQHAVLRPEESAQGDFKVKGPETALVKIIEFSDFQCPACRASQEVLSKMLETYPGQVRLEFRHFPLRGHKWSSVIHQAAQCAGLQNKFWPYHDILYSSQRQYVGRGDPTKKLLVYAAQLGIDLDQFATCMNDPDVRQVILDEKTEGVELKVTATPTFFVDGKRVVGYINLKNEGNRIIRERLGLRPEGADDER